MRVVDFTMYIIISFIISSLLLTLWKCCSNIFKKHRLYNFGYNTLKIIIVLFLILIIYYMLRFIGSPHSLTEFYVPTPLIINIEIIISIIWLIGMIKTVYSYKKAFKEMRYIRMTNIPCEDQDAIDVFNRCCKHMGIRRKLKLYSNEELLSPVIMDVINPKIVLPFESYSQDKLEIIFRHELTHYKHKDTFVRYLVIIVNCIHWVGINSNKLSDLVDEWSETVCDIKVCNKNQELFNSKEYFHVIYDIAVDTEKHILRPALYENKNLLEVRVIKIDEYNKLKRNGSYSNTIRVLAYVLIGCLIGYISYLAITSLIKLSTTYDRIKIIEDDSAIVNPGMDKNDESQIEGYEPTNILPDIDLTVVDDEIRTVACNLPANTTFASSSFTLNKDDAVIIQMQSLNTEVELTVGLLDEKGTLTFVKIIHNCYYTYVANEAGTYSIIIMNESNASTDIDAAIFIKEDWEQ